MDKGLLQILLLQAYIIPNNSMEERQGKTRIKDVQEK